MMDTGSTQATIQADGWPKPIEASLDVIRATLYTGRFVDYFRLKIARPDGWELWGLHRPKKGWNIRTGTVQPRHELSAIRSGSKHAGKRLRSSFFGICLNRFDYFEVADVERVAAEFLEGASPPAFVNWVPFER